MIHYKLKKFRIEKLLGGFLFFFIALINSFFLAPVALAQSLPPPPGIRADCRNERPYTIGELLDLAHASSSLEEFLRNLPSGVLQTYTLMEQSESSQSEGVDRLHPRVIRSSSGGSSSVTIAYGCNPRSRHYGQVEVIYQDASTGREHAQLLTFRNARRRRRERPGQPQTLVATNPSSCMGCHTGGTGNPIHFRHNFHKYNEWPGAHGHRDDSLSPTERRNYLDFLRAQRNNPCYNTLPRPPITQDSPADDAIFPYSTRTKPPSLYIRPNFHLTALYSRDLSLRNFHLIFDRLPQGQRELVMALMAERRVCAPANSPAPAPAAELIRIFGAANLSMSGPNPYGLGQTQWSLSPLDSASSSFNSGLSAFDIENGLLENMMTELGTRSPQINTALVSLRSDSSTLDYLREIYGSEHDCIYPTADYLSFSTSTSRTQFNQVCDALRNHIVQLRQTPGGTTPAVENSPAPQARPATE